MTRFLNKVYRICVITRKRSHYGVSAHRIRAITRKQSDFGVSAHRVHAITRQRFTTDELRSDFRTTFV